MFREDPRRFEPNAVYGCSSYQHCGQTSEGTFLELTWRSPPFLPLIWLPKAVATCSAVVAAVNVGKDMISEKVVMKTIHQSGHLNRREGTAMLSEVF